MQFSSPTSQWLPRHVLERAALEGERFLQEFRDSRFLVVDLTLSGDRLLAGLMARDAAASECTAEEPLTKQMINTVTRWHGPFRSLPEAAEQDARRLLELSGARASYVLALDHRVQDITREQVFIGRHADCDVMLKHLSVSKHHAVVSNSRVGALLVYDAESKNGTWINGNRIRRASPLCPGDRVRFGEVAAVVCTAAILRRALTLGAQPTPGA